MRFRAHLSHTRDIPALEFLWKWKVATTATLARKFFPTCSVATAYLRLRTLSKAGYLNSYVDRGGKAFVWTLTKMAFQSVVRPGLPQLKEETFQSENIYHDLLVSSAHLGEWLLKTPSGTELFTEQQLRSFFPESYPEWVPEIPNHRPDGFWKLPAEVEGSARVVALEVELSPKISSSYRDSGDCYRYGGQVSRVLWIVRDRTLANRIYKLATGRFQETDSIHNIVLLADFLRMGWESKILLGPESDKSILQLLHNSPITGPRQVMNQTLLDVRKSPHRSKTYAAPSIEGFRY